MIRHRGDVRVLTPNRHDRTTFRCPRCKPEVVFVEEETRFLVVLVHACGARSWAWGWPAEGCEWIESDEGSAA